MNRDMNGQTTESSQGTSRTVVVARRRHEADPRRDSQRPNRLPSAMRESSLEIEEIIPRSEDVHRTSLMNGNVFHLIVYFESILNI